MKRFGMTLMTVTAVLLVAGLGVKVTARPADTGGISGTIHFQGKAPVLHPIAMDKDPVCVSQQPEAVLPEDGRVNANGTLPNAFVYISKGTGNLSGHVPANSATLT